MGVVAENFASVPWLCHMASHKYLKDMCSVIFRTSIQTCMFGFASGKFFLFCFFILEDKQ